MAAFQAAVEAAKAVGSSDLRIIFKHIIPNCTAPIIVQATLGVATAILTADRIGTLPLVALGVFVITACFGFYLASVHYGKRVAIKRVVLTHAGFAITGALLLIAAVVMQ